MVFVEKKTIFLNQSKHSFKAAHIHSVDTSTSDKAGTHTISFIATKKDETKVTCTGPTNDKLYQKLVDKLQAWAHKNNPPETVVAPTTTKTPRRPRVFGKQTKRRKMPNILSYNWDDEDDHREDQSSKLEEEAKDMAHAVPVSERKADEAESDAEEDDTVLMGPPDNDDEEEEQEDFIIPAKTQTLKKTQRRRLVVEDSDDEDAPLTTPNPSTKRMVSPSLTAPAPKAADTVETDEADATDTEDSNSSGIAKKSLSSNNIQKGEDDDKATSEKLSENEGDESEGASMTSAEARPKNQPSIASFFAGGSKKTNKAAPAASRLASPPRKQRSLVATPQRRRFVKKGRHNEFPDDDAWLEKSAATVSPKKQQATRLLGNVDLKSPPRPIIPSKDEDPIEEFESPREPPVVDDPLDALDRVPHLPSRFSLSQKRKRTFARNGRLSPRFSPARTASKNLFGNRLSLPLTPEEKPQRRHRGLRNLGNTVRL